jgi:hypothetical protein
MEVQEARRQGWEDAEKKDVIFVLRSLRFLREKTIASGYYEK